MRIKVTCKEVHQLVSEELDRDLSWADRMRVYLHLHFWVCQACKNFENQMRFLHRAMRRLTVPDADEEKREL